MLLSLLFQLCQDVTLVFDESIIPGSCESVVMRYNIQEVFNDQLSSIQFNVLSDADKLTYLIRDVPRKVAKYIVKSYMRRRNALYN